MSSDRPATRGNETLGHRVDELTETLESLESSLDADRLVRPPTPREMVRFTREVTIPATILVLRTNIEALKLLQRTLEYAEGKGESDASDSRLRTRAEEAGQAALSQLEDALEDLQEALDGRPGDEQARRLLSEAQELRADVESELGESSQSTEPVDIDVDAELQAIKDDVDGDSGSAEQSEE